MKFSERNGWSATRGTLQLEDMDHGLRNRLWNTAYYHFLLPEITDPFSVVMVSDRLTNFIDSLFHELLELPIDETPVRDDVIPFFKRLFTEGVWWKVYDVVEAMVHHAGNKLADRFNHKLETCKAGYRFAGNTLTSITTPVELQTVDEAVIGSDQFAGAAEHLNAALKLYSDRKSPDYRNSIKESVSAVESIAWTVTGDKGANFGKLMAQLESDGVPGSLTRGFKNVFGYSSDSDGIRHAILEKPQVTSWDAKFFLVTCSAFVNYLTEKYSNHLPTHRHKRPVDNDAES